MRRDTRPLWLPEPVCDRLHYICPRQALSDVFGMKALLGQLRASVESHLGTGICFAGVGLPYKLQAKGYIREVVEEAIESVGLRQVGQTYEVSTAVAQVNFGQRKDQDSDLRVILVVDYSQYWLTLKLYKLRVHIKSRHFYNLTLGASNSGQPRHWEAIRAALEEILRGPFGWRRDELPERVQRLVLHGDSSFCPDFRGLLEDVIGSELMAVVEEFEPVFSGAMGIARNVHAKLNGGPWVYEPDLKPVYGCCLYSRFSSCGVDSWEDRIEDGEL